MNGNERIVHKIKISSGLFCIVLVCQNHREMNLQWTHFETWKSADKSPHTSDESEDRECVSCIRVSHVVAIISLSIARGQTIERSIHFVHSQRTPFKSITLMRIISCAWRFVENLLRHTIPPQHTTANFEFQYWGNRLCARTGQFSCNRRCCRVHRRDL